MAKTPNTQGFSLIISAPGFETVVTLPKIKKGVTTVGGDKTYLMAIDRFTTHFNTKEEMIDYIIENNLASIPSDIPYNQIYIHISHQNKEHNYGCLPIAYSSEQDLVDFLNNNKIAESFLPEHQCVQDFRQTIIDRWSKGMYQVEYRMYMEEYKNVRNPFGRDLKDTLKKLDKRRKFNDFKNGTLALGPLTHYHNLRAHLITKSKLDERLHEIFEKHVLSYNERAEYEREKAQEAPKPISSLTIMQVPETKSVVEKEAPAQLALFDDNLFFDKDAIETHKTR